MVSEIHPELAEREQAPHKENEGNNRIVKNIGNWKPVTKTQRLLLLQKADEGFSFPCACSMPVLLCSIHTSVSIDVSEEKSRDESF